MKCPRFLLIATLALFPVAMHTQSSIAPRDQREAAVAQARAGNAKTALEELRKLLDRYPDDPRLLGDTIIVAGWAGDDAYALRLYNNPHTPHNDNGAVESAAHSARNLHQFDLALDLYHQAQQLDPQRWLPQLGMAMVLTDQNQLDPAAALMQPLLRDHLAEKEVEAGEAYLCSRQHDFACVVDMDQRLLAQTPAGDPDTQCQMADALSRLGAETLAQDICSQSSPALLLRLNAAAGAERVRWTESSNATWVQRKAEGEQALSFLETVIAGSPALDEVWKQAQFDRILALSDLQRHGEVVQLWERLNQSGIIVPDYALSRVAQAYLALRQPQAAARLYTALLKNSPDDGELRSGLAYAQIESQHLRESLHSIDQAYREAPVWIVSSGLKVPQINSFHTSLGLQAAEMRASLDMLADEQKRLEALLNLAPANPGLRRALAMNDDARGWPLRALREERIADGFSLKDDLPVLEDAETLEAAGRRDEADTIIPPLILREGHSLPVDRYLRERAIERGWQLDISGDAEWSSGQFVGTTQHGEEHLYTPLIHNRWRLYDHALGDTGTFREGSAYRSRAAIGFRYDYERQTIWAEFAGDTGTTRNLAAVNIGGEFNFGDHWSLRASADSDSVTDVPLIAELGAVRARSGDVDFAWRQNELRSVTVGAQRLLFTDGNQRTAFTGSWEQRIWTAPRIQITVSPEGSTSANSMNENRIYFNPARDFSVGPRLTLNWLAWRRYDRSFQQVIAVYAAPYWQQNYSLGKSFVGSYEARAKLGPRFGLMGRITWNSQPYDGATEPYTALNFDLTW